MANRTFSNKHNVVVNLDLNAPGAADFHQILTFLQRSRLSHVLTHSPVLLEVYIRQFWENIRRDRTVTPNVIRTRVNNIDIHFSAADLREILQLGTEAQENGPTEFPVAFRAGALQRMGYVGALESTQYIKSLVFGQWRYLIHVMVTALGAKKAGFDEINIKLLSGLLSLVYNKPYSFSRYIYDCYVDQIDSHQRYHFLLFPRFTMMIINHLVPNLPPSNAVLRVSTLDRKIFQSCLKHHPNRAGEQRPVETPLFGFLLNEHYVAPPNDGWEDVEQQAEQAGEDVAEAAPDAGEDIPVAQEQQHLVDDVLHQVEHPQPGVEPVNPEVAAAVIQEILPQVDQPEDIFADIDNYVPDAEAGQNMPEAGFFDDIDAEFGDDVPSAQVNVDDPGYATEVIVSEPEKGDEDAEKFEADPTAVVSDSDDSDDDDGDGLRPPSAKLNSSDLKLLENLRLGDADVMVRTKKIIDLRIVILKRKF